MATAVKRLLSSSTDGKAIKIAATATAGTAIHTAVAGTTPGTYDEVWLWAFNSSAAAVVLTVEFGGATAPDQNIVISIPSKAGWTGVVPGLILQNGATVAAFAATTNVITVSGFVNSMTD
jgi:hypothetical protein